VDVWLLEGDGWLDGDDVAAAWCAQPTPAVDLA
jgi:hypothetical protein